MTDGVRGTGRNDHDADQPTAEQLPAVPATWPAPPSWPAASSWPTAPGGQGVPPPDRPAPWGGGVPAPRAPLVTAFPPGGYAAPPYAGPPQVASQSPGYMGPPYVGPPYVGPPYVGPPQAAPPSRGPRGTSARRGILIALALVLVAATGSGVTWFVLRGHDNGQTAAPGTIDAPLSQAAPGNGNAGGGALPGGASPSRAPAATTSAPATPPAMTEQEALAELETLRGDSLPRLVTDGRWVAQVASKSVGITDPLQTAANGSHTFYAVDILAESREATSSVSASSVLVLRSTDFGKRSYAGDGQAYWITVVDVGFAGSAAVDAWCASTYPALDAEQLANACAPRTLTPPHD